MTEPTLMPTIQQALKDLRHGHVQIVVHEGQIVRIERVERIHLPQQTNHAQRPTEKSGGHLNPSS